MTIFIPERVAEFERHVRADAGPAVVIIDRDTMRAFFDWAREMEKQLKEEGSFW